MKKQKTLESLKSDLFVTETSVINGGGYSNSTQEAWYNDKHTCIVYDTMVDGQRKITGWEHIYS